MLLEFFNPWWFASSPGFDGVYLFFRNQFRQPILIQMLHRPELLAKITCDTSICLCQYQGKYISYGHWSKISCQVWLQVQQSTGRPSQLAANAKEEERGLGNALFLPVVQWQGSNSLSQRQNLNVFQPQHLYNGMEWTWEHVFTAWSLRLLAWWDLMGVISPRYSQTGCNSFQRCSGSAPAETR